MSKRKYRVTVAVTHFYSRIAVADDIESAVIAARKQWSEMRSPSHIVEDNPRWEDDGVDMEGSFSARSEGPERDGSERWTEDDGAEVLKVSEQWVPA